MRRFFSYLILTLLMIVFSYYGFKLTEEQNFGVAASTKAAAIFTVIFPIVIGLLLRLPELLLEMKKKKVRTYDWIKFSAVGVPALLISQMYYLSRVLPYEMAVANEYTSLPVIAGVVFGYVLLDSLTLSQKKKTVIR
ncbi:hypothetical protein [Halobacillus massiliensis]|uniref:hypothetical protein n=1 Tax=Halobacillus massiliensis TaxID=1926286 RepID=UPI0009E1C4A0|nr:hypothetical protein [Halobacillus massiliensis]